VDNGGLGIRTVFKTQGYARRRYGEFIKEGIGEGYRREFHYGIEGGRILGEDRFAEEVLRGVEKKENKRITIDRIIDTVRKIYGVNEEDIRSRSRLRRLTEISKLIGYIVVEYGEGTLKEYSSRVNRDITTMSKEVNELRERIKKDRDTREKLNELLEELNIEENKY